MVNLGLIHCDETGIRIDGKTWWVYNASDMDFIYLTIDRKRGRIGMGAAGILPDFRGIVVHDCRGSYWKYQDALHTVCCAHLLRKLNGVEENHPEQKWAAKFKELLFEY